MRALEGLGARVLLSAGLVLCVWTMAAGAADDGGAPARPDSAGVNARDRMGRTPLILAVEKGQADEVRRLLASGADVGAESVFGTALHRACWAGRAEIARLLLDAGARTDARWRGLTPLLLSVVTGWLDVASALVQRGADVEARDESGRTALHRTLIASHARVAPIALLLMDHGARVDTEDAGGDTPLLAAARGGHVEAARGLIEKGADVRGRERDTGRTPLHVVALSGYGDIAAALIAHGADVQARDGHGRTALDYALEHGNAAVAARLAAAGAARARAGGADVPVDAARVRVGAREAVVWQLKTRGWAVRTHGHLLLFDQEEAGARPDRPSLANGHVTVREIADLDAVALYTCYHAEPGTLEFVHGMEDSLRSVAYVHRKADEWRGGRSSVYLEGPERRLVAGVEVAAAEVDRSAFSLDCLVRTDGLTVFYGGFYPDSLAAFREEIDFLAQSGARCDLAFLQTGGAYLSYARYAIERLRPRAVLPVDPDHRRAAVDEMAAWIAREFPGVQVGCAVDPGDRLTWRRGRLDAIHP